MCSGANHGDCDDGDDDDDDDGDDGHDDDGGDDGGHNVKVNCQVQDRSNMGGQMKSRAEASMRRIVDRVRTHIAAASLCR